MLRWVCALITAAIVTGFAFLLVTGRYSNDGAVLISVTGGHGLHEGDLFVIAGWVVAMGGLFLLARTPASAPNSVLPIARANAVPTAAPATGSRPPTVTSGATTPS